MDIGRIVSISPDSLLCFFGWEEGLGTLAQHVEIVSESGSQATQQVCSEFRLCNRTVEATAKWSVIAVLDSS